MFLLAVALLDGSSGLGDELLWSIVVVSLDHVLRAILI
jgi:hypothetical protein